MESNEGTHERIILLMMNKIRAAQSIGGPLYTSGKVAASIQVYKRVIREMLSPKTKTQLAPQCKEALDSATEYLTTSLNDQEKAWVLRKAIDKVYDHYVDEYCCLGVMFVPVFKKIGKAIDLGTPMYNAGRIEECKKLYARVAAEILRNPEDLTTNGVNLLKESIAVSEEANDPDVGVRKLRKALDYVYDASRLPEIYHINDNDSEGSVLKRQSATLEVDLLDYTSNNVSSTLFTPRLINDTVMGGKSSSEFSQVRTPDGEQYAVFQGSVLRVNNGGFASVRLVPKDKDAFHEAIQNCCGFLVSVKCLTSENTRFKFQMASESKLKSFNWQTDLLIPQKKDFSQIYLPLSSFWPTMFGHVLSNCGNVELDKVDSFGLIISHLKEDCKMNPDFHEGQFSIALEWVKVIKEVKT